MKKVSKRCIDMIKDTKLESYLDLWVFCVCCEEEEASVVDFLLVEMRDVLLDGTNYRVYTSSMQYSLSEMHLYFIYIL